MLRILRGAGVPTLETEVVERKGSGHPDTLCDALAEHLSVQLSRYYLEHFGAVLHHNVDKALLAAGGSQPRFGGGEISEPMDIYLAGRATLEVRGKRVPVEEIAVEGTKQWLREHLPLLDPERHVRIHPRLRPGSSELTALFEGRASGPPRANDSSIGVGFAPLTGLERLVLDVEERLNSREYLAVHPEAGRDVKVLGYRYGNSYALTIARAFVASNLANLDEYLGAKLSVLSSVQAFGDELGAPLACVVNARDEPEAGAVFLTVTGTSAESGDDGQVGRGNRPSGLITPHRPMSLEAVAGKNPVNHTGKLYNLIARDLAHDIVARVPEARGATCFLVSQIGTRIDEPSLVQIILDHDDPAAGERYHGQIQELVHSHLESIPHLTERLLEGQVRLF